MVVTVRDTPGSVAGLQVTVGDVFEQERAPAWKLELIRRVAR